MKIIQGPKLDEINYGLDNDMLFGWKPSITLKAPFPIYFIDKKREGIQNKVTVVYKGFLPRHSYLMHDQYSGLDTYSLYDDGFTMYKKPNIQKMTKEDNGDCFPYQNLEGGSVIFNSCFESGNLDSVIRRDSKTYELFLRVDSNTRGHTQW